MECMDYSVCGTATLEDESWATVMRGTTRFTITVRNTRNEKTRFGKEYLLQIKNSLAGGNNTSNTFAGPTTLLCSQCLHLLKTLAPQTSTLGLPMEDLCHCTIYLLELVGTADETDVRIEGAEHVFYAPAFDISPMPTCDLPESCKGVPRVQASDVLIVPTPEKSNPRDIRTSQGKVNTADGLTRYFKSCLVVREVAFERELSILSRINEDGLRSGETRLSNLVGIVV